MGKMGSYYGRKKKKIYASRPCLTNALFLGDKPIGLDYLDKSGLGNDIPFSDSNCLELNGIDVTFDTGQSANSQYIYRKFRVSNYATQYTSEAYFLTNTVVADKTGYAIRVYQDASIGVFFFYANTFMYLYVNVPLNVLDLAIENDRVRVYADSVMVHDVTLVGTFNPPVANDIVGSRTGTTAFAKFKLGECSAINQQLTEQELESFIEGDCDSLKDKLAYCFKTSAGDGTQVHDVKNNTGVTLQGTLTGVWSKTDLQHDSINNGFSLSGNKVVDTDTAITQDTPVDITVNLKMQIGVRELDANCIIGNYSGFYGIEFGDLSIITTVAFDNKSHRFRIENKEFFIDEVLAADLSLVSDFETSYNFYIGAINENHTTIGTSIYDTYTSVEVDGVVVDLSSLQYIELPAQLDDPTLDVNDNALTNPAISGHNGCSTLMDFTSLGTSIGKVAYDEVIPELNSIYWRKDYLVGGIKTGETLHLVKSTPDTGKCFNGNVKFYDAEIVTEEDDIVDVTEEDGMTYVIED